MKATTRLGHQDVTEMLEGYCAGKGLTYLSHTYAETGELEICFEVGNRAPLTSASAPLAPPPPPVPAPPPVTNAPLKTLSLTELRGGDPATDVVHELGSVPVRSFPKEDDSEMARLIRQASVEKTMEMIGIKTKAGL